MIIIDRDGNEVDGVIVPDCTSLFDLFRVRVIKDTFNDEGIRVKREVTGEEDFQNFPNDKQIVYCIAKHHGSFAVVEKIFSLQYLPFA